MSRTHCTAPELQEALKLVADHIRVMVEEPVAQPEEFERLARDLETIAGPQGRTKLSGMRAGTVSYAMTKRFNRDGATTEDAWTVRRFNPDGATAEDAWVEERLHIEQP